MDKFELYMIDNLKRFADMLRLEKEKNIAWMERCVLGELIEVFVKYEAYTNGITSEDTYYEEDEELNFNMLVGNGKPS